MVDPVICKEMNLKKKNQKRYTEVLQEAERKTKSTERELTVN